jgi:hypothetical protein
MPPLHIQDELATGTRWFSPPTAPAPRGLLRPGVAGPAGPEGGPNGPVPHQHPDATAAGLPLFSHAGPSSCSAKAKRRHPTAPSGAAECPFSRAFDDHLDDTRQYVPNGGYLRALSWTAVT